MQRTQAKKKAYIDLFPTEGTFFSRVSRENRNNEKKKTPDKKIIFIVRSFKFHFNVSSSSVV